VPLIVVADVRLHREGIVNSLSGRDAFDVVGAASSAEDALALVGSADSAILVLDMVTHDSHEIASTISARVPAVKTIAFAVGDSEREILACVDAGMAGYVSRDASIDDLVAAIESVIRGDLPVPPRIAATLFRRLGPIRKGEREAPSQTLTARERQILLLIDEGLSNKEIAERLSIEVATVKNHVHSLLTKMHVNTRGQAAARLGGNGASRQQRAGASDRRPFIA
jgi:DNA-binding NarL/FixJ family response regulator